MQIIRLTCLAALAQGLALGGAQAGDCHRLGAVGDGLTKDIAVVMSTHGLQNIIEGKGLKGQGPVKTTCEPGTIMVECHSSQLACK